MKKNIDLGLLVLRVSVSVLMLFHGVSKLLDGAAGVKFLLASKGLPEILAYGVWVGEVVAPLLILVGFRTRLAAAVFAFNLVVALFMAHGSHLFALSDHGGLAIELPLLYLLAGLVLFFTGGGRLALSSGHRWD